MSNSILTFNNPRSMKANKLDSGIEFVFTPEKNCATTGIAAFLGVWLLGWLGGEIAAISALITGNAKSGYCFLIFWLTGWSVGGFIFINIFLALLFGKRVLRIKPLSLEIQDTFGLWRKRSYFPMSDVHNLRIDTEEQKTHDDKPYTLWCISADCGDKRTVLASSAKESDLTEVFETMKNSGLFSPNLQKNTDAASEAGKENAPENSTIPEQEKSTQGGTDDEMYFPDLPDDLK
ncbi:MAG: hypothetical protein LWY06_18895 [Firmicutes bacterium]|nr:hypothetical protein [Bacillota bacterium]